MVFLSPHKVGCTFLRFKTMGMVQDMGLAKGRCAAAMPFSMEILHGPIRNPLDTVVHPDVAAGRQARGVTLTYRNLLGSLAMQHVAA